MPLDWPRMNQFPEWFTVEREAEYVVEDRDAGTRDVYSGAQLIEGIPTQLGAGQELRLVVHRTAGP